MRFALTLAGVAAPEVRVGCEIGFGGLSSAIASATRPGTDWRAAFDDAARAAEVGGLAEHAGLALEVSAGIEKFCARDDLPMFDYIGVTNNWSELGEAARAAVRDLLTRRLRPGGVFFASYLVQPGAGQDTPLRVLGRTLLRGATPDDADFSARFSSMLDEAEAALTAAPLMLTRHTDFLGQIAALRANPDPAAMWRRWFDPQSAPTTFLDFSGLMSAAGLSFATSAELANFAPEINFTPRQRAALAAIDDADTREQMIDLISYSWGRADYWVKAPTLLDAEARAQALRETRLTLAQPAAKFDFRVMGLLGHVSLRREVYGPLLQRLEQTPGAPLADLPADTATVTEAAALLVAAGVARVIGNDDAAGIRDSCRRLNNALFAHASGGRAAATACASPELVGGLDVDPRVMRLMAAWVEGARDTADLARRCATIEAAAGVSDEGEAMRISRDARDFLSDLGEYERLGVL